MYGGFPAANQYVNGYVAPEMAKRHGVKVRQVPARDISEAVSKLLVEKQAGVDKGGSADLLWINGENFRTCKRLGLLHGPFANSLPNSKYVDSSDPAAARDFGEPVGGMESPWGSARFVMVYDQARTPDPPGSMSALIEWIKARPGRFTYPAPPDFTGSAFVRHVFYHVSGEVDYWQGDFEEARFEKAAKETFGLLTELKPYLWREGRTYPESPARLGQLLADGQVDFAMSYHPAEASKMIADGLYPGSVRTFVFEEGTIANTHFVAIPFNAGDIEGAMVLANFLLSPEAQLEKASAEVWGDLPALDMDKLPPDWRERFAEAPRGPATLPEEILAERRLPELPSGLLVRLEKGWDQHVLKGR